MRGQGETAPQLRFRQRHRRGKRESQGARRKLFGGRIGARVVWGDFAPCSSAFAVWRGEDQCARGCPSGRFVFARRKSTMNKKIGILWISILATGLGFSGCKRQGDGGGGAHKAPPHPEAAIVTVATVTNALWDRTVSIVGTLYPKDEALVSAQVDGMVEKTLVDFGDRVKSGQELALIDTTTHEANLQAAVGDTARAVAALTNATRGFERSKELVKAQVSSTAEFDEAKAQFEQASAELKAAQGKEAVARLA